MNALIKHIIFTQDEDYNERHVDVMRILLLRMVQYLQHWHYLEQNIQHLNSHSPLDVGGLDRETNPRPLAYGNTASMEGTTTLITKPNSPSEVRGQ
jgi:hypothetical protein